jgi:hypothetical protein
MRRGLPTSIRWHRAGREHGVNVPSLALLGTRLSRFVRDQT